MFDDDASPDRQRLTTQRARPSSDRVVAVELDEVAQRVLRRHLVLIVVMTLLGLGGAVLLQHLRERDYIATTRVTMGTPDTHSSQESTALADAATGIVTSQGAVRAALKTAQITRDPVDVAVNHIQVTPVGTSGVLELAVSDPDRAAAAAVANTLAGQLVASRRASTRGDTEALLEDVRRRTVLATQKLQAAQEAAAGAATKAAGTFAQRGLTDPTVGDLELRLVTAAREYGDVQAQFDRVIESLSAMPLPAVLDPAVAADIPPPVDDRATLALGALLGLLLGVAAAAVLEVTRPTLGPQALSSHLGTPLLGHLRRSPDRDARPSDPWLVEYLTLAVNAAGVRAVRLVPVGRQIDLSGLAERLRGVLHRHGDVDALLLPSRPRPFTDEAEPPPLPPSGRQPLTGLVVVAPRVVRKADLVPLERHLLLTGRPLLGIITYPGARLSLRPVVPGEPLPPQEEAAAVPSRPVVSSF